MEQKEKKFEQKQVAFEKGFVDMIKKRAQITRRSIKQEIVYLVETALAQQEKLEKLKKE